MELESLPEASRKREKIRSVWISFAGRIAAQLIGAIATVTLGVIVLGGRQPAPAPPAAVSAAAPTVLVATPVRTQGETVIVMLPVGPDGVVDRSLATRVAESFEQAKASPLADGRPQTPTGLPVPRSDDPWDGTHASLASPRE